MCLVSQHHRPVAKGAGHRLYSAPTRRVDAAAVAAEIRDRLRAKDLDRALRALLQLNDNLVAESGLVRGVRGLAEPEPTGDVVWDAAIAALVAWRLGEEGLPLPAWVNGSCGFLSEPRVLTIDPADPVPPFSEIPPEFAERGVIAWRDTFVSVLTWRPHLIVTTSLPGFGSSPPISALPAKKPVSDWSEERPSPYETSIEELPKTSTSSTFAPELTRRWQPLPHGWPHDTTGIRPGRDTRDIRMLLGLCDVESLVEAEDLYEAF